MFDGSEPIPRMALAGDLALPLSFRALPASPLQGWQGTVKRLLDILLGGLLLAACGAPMLLLALLVRLDSPGPVLFRQRRIGLGGADFVMLKFRTMRVHAAPAATLCQARPGDPRVTRLGAVLRRLSLDELPQLINVLRGDMSLVGPRPHAPGTCAGGRPFEQVTARYAARHRVRPGMTGLAQVRGWRGATETEEKLLRRVDSDLEYIETWSLWRDLLILAGTVRAVCGMCNAH